MALLGLALLGSSPGCTPGGLTACTMIGCSNGLSVELREGALARVDGPSTMRVCIDGECTESEQAGSPMSPVVQVFHELPDARPGRRASVRVEVIDGDGVAFSAMRTADFRASRPNGRRCPPVCNQAHLVFGR